MTAWFAACASSAQAGEIKLEINGCIPGKEVQVALYSSAKGFSEDRDGRNALYKQVIKAEGSIVHLSFVDLHTGKYAVGAFVDSNGNHKLDTNLVGMPNEPYGFSRDARNLLSAPSFEQAAFEVGEGSIAQTIHLK